LLDRLLRSCLNRPYLDIKTATTASNNDTGTALDNYRMLQDFFTLFPEYQGRTFYIAGESYAGMYVPMLADEIRRGNDRGEPFINLQVQQQA